MIIITSKLQNHRFILTKEKIPIEKVWQDKTNYTLTDPRFQDHLSKNSTYGVLCGYNNLMVIDLDYEPLQQELILNHPELFKNTFTVKSGGKGLLHFYFYVDAPPISFKGMDKDKNTLFDAQGIGKQVIGHGSTLSTGGVYTIVNDVEIKQVSYKVLKAIFDGYDLVSDKEPTLQPKEAIVVDDEAQEIKAKLSIPSFLREIGISTKKNPTDCPFHESKGGKCLSYTEVLFNCFHCGAKGDIISLYQKYHLLSIKDTFSILKERVGITKRIRKTEEMKEKEEEKAKKKEEKEEKRDRKEEEREIKRKEREEKREEREKEKKIKDEEMFEKEEKKRMWEEEKEKAIQDYKELNITKYVIYKSGEDTEYKIYINEFFVLLKPQDLLTCDMFRKNLFNEIGRLLRPINNFAWTKLVNGWVEKYGEMIEHKDISSNNYITEAIINEIQTFVLVLDPKSAVSYGRLLFYQEDPGFVYCCNKVIDNIIKKNQFKVTLNKVKLMLEDYVSGNTKVIRAGATLYRFFRFKLSSLKELDVSYIPKMLEAKEGGEED